MDEALPRAPPVLTGVAARAARAFGHRATGPRHAGPRLLAQLADGGFGIARGIARPPPQLVRLVARPGRSGAGALAEARAALVLARGPLALLADHVPVAGSIAPGPASFKPADDADPQGSRRRDSPRRHRLRCRRRRAPRARHTRRTRRVLGPIGPPGVAVAARGSRHHPGHADADQRHRHRVVLDRVAEVADELGAAALRAGRSSPDRPAGRATAAPGSHPGSARRRRAAGAPRARSRPPTCRPDRSRFSLRMVIALAPSPAARHVAASPSCGRAPDCSP